MMKLYCEELTRPGVTELERTIHGRNGFVGVFDAQGFLECPEDCGIEHGTGVQVVEGTPVSQDQIDAAARPTDGPLVEWFAPSEMIGQRIVAPKGHLLTFEAYGGQARGFAPDNCNLDDPSLRGYYRRGGPAESAAPAPRADEAGAAREKALEAEVASLRARLALQEGQPPEGPSSAPEPPHLGSPVQSAPKPEPEKPKVDPKKAAQEARQKAQAAARAAIGGS